MHRLDKIETNSMGEGYRVIDGQEQTAVWLPLSKAEMEDVIRKSLATNAAFPAKLADAVRAWVGGRELSLEELQPEVKRASLEALQRYNSLLTVSGISRVEDVFDMQAGTTMCGW